MTSLINSFCSTVLCAVGSFCVVRRRFDQTDQLQWAGEYGNAQRHHAQRWTESAVAGTAGFRGWGTIPCHRCANVQQFLGRHSQRTSACVSAWCATANANRHFNNTSTHSTNTTELRTRHPATGMCIWYVLRLWRCEFECIFEFSIFPTTDMHLECARRRILYRLRFDQDLLRIPR